MLQRMKTLIAKLTEADIAYYKNDAPIMTDWDYDLLYDELTQSLLDYPTRSYMFWCIQQSSPPLP